MTRSFRRHWPELLDLHSAEDRNNAQREAEDLERQQLIKLHRKFARAYIILKIEVPLEKESWLRGVFLPPEQD